MTSTSLRLSFLAAFLGSAYYLWLVRSLRHRRRDELLAEYADILDSKDIKSKLSPAQAQKIVHIASLYEFPFVYIKSLEFALFKTYGIGTISKLLLKTGQLSKKENASRRYVDTSILIASMVLYPLYGPGSGTEATNTMDVDPRGALALARINYIHRLYPTITNEEFLYTLALFVFEPISWINRFEWRKVTQFECEAFFILWVELGRRMGIQNIPDSLADLETWRNEYEEKHMKPSPINQEVASHTITLLLHDVPPVLKPLGRRIIYSLLETRLREAMMFPEQPKLLIGFVHGLLRVRAFFIKHFLLPREIPKNMPPLDTDTAYISVKDGEAPRMHPLFHLNDPWYVKPNTGFRRAIERLLITVGLASEESFPGARRFQSEGYRLEQMGPKHMETKGHEKVMQMAEELQGCPVKGVWSLEGAGCPIPGMSWKGLSANGA
ncbi:hypothetical protein SISSUDRAFT_1055557 [Sistotremastrum suecicum HHB10207 ss-3]|uniref:ER-bound oxygenase mpaB/mpaB'/Rubber oxygenase catalytic domain-containing protein n=1 Tax=Sistotremastrum suecicum HHB10207 ss-3 TaxID=1314776 RepID=A0A165XPN3_9AGAM|nr:hypothetical protein SISSUDRAFT_1055557 [Sistotremastrum suecicum HHB10207 ss-3]